MGGVYIIRTPRGVIDHVGSTYRGKQGLKQRLTDHLQGRSSYVIKEHDGIGRQLRSGYTYACLAIRHERTRSLVEHLAIGTLCPRHLGTHQKAGR